MKIAAFAAALLLATGVIFKTQHWPGAHVIYMIGIAAGVISSVSMVGSVLPRLEGIERISIPVSSIVILIGLLSFLFKLMHWPGAAKLVWITDLGLIVSGVLLLIDGMQEKDPVKSALKIIAMFFVLFLLMLIVLMA